MLGRHYSSCSVPVESEQHMHACNSFFARRKLHAYLEPRMLRRMKAVCLAGQMPPKVQLVYLPVQCIIWRTVSFGCRRRRFCSSRGYNDRTQHTVAARSMPGSLGDVLPVHVHYAPGTRDICLPPPLPTCRSHAGWPAACRRCRSVPISAAAGAGLMRCSTAPGPTPLQRKTVLDVPGGLRCAQSPYAQRLRLNTCRLAGSHTSDQCCLFVCPPSCSSRCTTRSWPRSGTRSTPWVRPAVPASNTADLPSAVRNLLERKSMSSLLVHLMPLG